MEWSDTHRTSPIPTTTTGCAPRCPTTRTRGATTTLAVTRTWTRCSSSSRDHGDPEERKADHPEITKYMHDKVYWFGIYDDPDYWMVGERLTDVKFSGVTPFYSIMEWDVQ